MTAHPSANPVVRLTVQTAAGNTITVRGRDAWALDALIASGFVGVTPLHNPAPRWSGYVHKLRKAGLLVETIDEGHKGPFAGTHARYVLRSPVSVLETVRQHDAKAKEKSRKRQAVAA